MSEAPERIWITGDASTGSWNSIKADFKGPTETEYVRADRIAELEAKLAKVIDFVAEVEAGPSWGESLVDWANLKVLNARTLLAELTG